MLVDPITVAASSPTPLLTFKMVRQDGYGSERWDVPNKYALTISHAVSPKTGERHYVKLSQDVDATSPYTGGISKQTASVSMAISIPPFGWDNAAKVALIKALTDTLNDSDVTYAGIINFQS